jgi:GPH family glycoside/pentoside/hexuronide:cation symporter
MNETREHLEYKEPSLLNTIAYGSAGFWDMLAYGVFNAYLIFFYEAVVGLNIAYIFLAMIIFTVWDAVNDPILGHLTDRITKFTRKIGKRFIWIVIGIIPANFVLALIFMPPAGNPSTEPLPFFWWIVFTTVLFDSLYSLAFVNINALFPDKFRTDRARRRARGWGTPLSMLGLPVAQMIPPIILGIFGKQEVTVQASYIPMIWIIVGTIAPVSLFLLIGMRENKELIERYYISKEKPESFIAALKSTLKQKSFVYYIILFFGFQVVTGSLTASIPFAANFILPAPPLGIPVNMIVLFATFLNGAIISVPIWIKIAKRINNNKKTAVIGGICLVIGAFIVPFSTPNLIASIIFMVILGLAIGNFWVLMTIYFADVLDERVIITKSPNRGATVGISAFLSRFARAAQIGIFAIVHLLTGFAEGASTQTSLAQVGIWLHMGIIPAIILAICTLIYWKYYPITGEVWMENKKKLKELGF